METGEKMYTVEAAATILGVPPERVQELVSQGLVTVSEQGGQQVMTKAEVMRMFDNVTPDPASTNAEIERAKALSKEKQSKVDKIKGMDSVIIVENQDVVELYDELMKHVDRVKHLIQRCQRLEGKIKSHKMQAGGHDAELHELIMAAYPQLSGKSFEPEKLEDGTLVLKIGKQQGGNENDFKRRFHDMFVEGQKRGLIPPNIMFGPPGGFPNGMEDYDDDD